MVQKFKFCLLFRGSCLKQKKRRFYSSKYNKFFIGYELDAWSRDLNSDFTLKDCLFEDVKLAKNADPHKYVYSGYGIRFDSHSQFSLTNGSVGKDVIIFEKKIRKKIF